MNVSQRLERALQGFRPFVTEAWQHRGLLFKINAAVIFISVGVLLFLVKPYYDSSVVVLPDFRGTGGGILSELSGLSSLAGLSTANLGKGISPEVYENLVQSESVLSPVFLAKYRTESFDSPVDLIQYFDVEPDESLPYELRRRQMMLDLYEEFVDSRLFVNTDRITGILSITVRMPESRLSADVANMVAHSLNNYVIEKNRSFAREQMEYIERRITEVKDSLTKAENELKEFQEKNRSIGGSPELVLRHARLLRAIELRQAVFVELVKQHEITRIEELKDTPILNIREEAREPIEKTGPRRTLILAFIAFISLIISTVGVYLRPLLAHMHLIVKGEITDQRSTDS